MDSLPHVRVPGRLRYYFLKCLAEGKKKIFPPICFGFKEENKMELVEA